MQALLSELDRRDRVLSRLGWFQVGLLLLILAAMPFDSRTVLGLNPWIKPAKFAASIALYVWTLAWFMPYLTGPGWAKGLVRWGTVVAMVIEIVCIAGQSLRGATSHFNHDTPLDGAIFSVMGLMIMFSTGLDVILLVLFFGRHVPLAPAYLWGIRAGLIGLICTAAIGMLMVARESHTVGAADGGPGLPLVNWSTTSGDLRIAHALALHALQVLPLAGYFISRKVSMPSQGVALLGLVVICYALLCVAVLGQALAGQPLWAVPHVSQEMS